MLKKVRIDEAEISAKKLDEFYDIDLYSVKRKGKMYQ